MNIKSITIALLLSLLTACPVWAASKTVTTRVSCTILPIIELEATPTSAQVDGNLGSAEYRMRQDISDRNGTRTKLYSITAL